MYIINFHNEIQNNKNNEQIYCIKIHIFFYFFILLKKQIIYRKKILILYSVARLQSDISTSTA